MRFFYLDITVVFIVLSIVSIMLVINIGTREVVTKALIMALTLVVVADCVLEVDVPAGNHCKVFWNEGYKEVVGINRRILKFIGKKKSSL